jgi:hypothetical protein
VPTDSFRRWPRAENRPGRKLVRRARTHAVYRGSVGLIQTDAAGLMALAAHCEAHAGPLGAVSVPSRSGGAFAPSALAVQAAHTEVAAAGARLAARMEATAAAATAAAGIYVTSDTGNAADIWAVGTTVV